MALMALVAPTAATASAATGVGAAAVQRYVALGDSYASGAGVPKQVHLTCLRSNRNYPSLVAAEISPGAVRDVTCGGATTAAMTKSHLFQYPQFNALTADTDLVTLGIGGNDIDFIEIVIRCTTLAVINPTGSPCKNSYTSGGTDQLAETIAETAPLIAATLDGIRQRAPQARVLLVGYPSIVPDDGSRCRPYGLLADGDIPYLRDTTKLLNGMLRAQALAHGAEYVDTYTPSIGHDACQPAADRWVEPLIPAAPAAPFHPNAAGEAGMAEAVLAALAG
ncbi:SGNH/GDSL hydrolase family protein [Allostreptomyces psammosilenae]|nr:SGNH/GDSL hydrolase family protein [Allostreptomyces psammosilenae]